MIKVIGISNKKTLQIQDKMEKYVKLLRIGSKLGDNDIVIKFVKKYRYLKATDYAMYMVNVVKRPNNSFKSNHEIIVNKKILYSDKRLSMTLMHELVHIKQVLDSKLAYVQYRTGTGIFAFWKKSKLGKLDDLDYWSRPWEVEARKIEEQMWKEGRLY